MISPEAEVMSSHDSVKNKKALIDKLLEEIVCEKNKQKKQLIKYRRRNNFLKGLTHFANAISVSSLLSSFATNIIGVIIGASCATISTSASAINDGQNNQDKHLTSRTTYNQLSNLERNTRAQLIRNHLSSQQIDDMVSDINHQLALINDTILN